MFLLFNWTNAGVWCLRMGKKWKSEKICCRLKCVMECKSGGGDGDGGV